MLAAVLHRHVHVMCARPVSVVPYPHGVDPLQADELPDGWQYDYAGRCWWCEAEADSREHKWKRSDIVRIYGPGPYGGELLWGNEHGQSRILQGSRSSELKYKATLCQRCNNARSQPLDRAYDVWAGFVSAPPRRHQGLERV